MLEQNYRLPPNDSQINDYFLQIQTSIIPHAGMLSNFHAWNTIDFETVADCLVHAINSAILEAQQVSAQINTAVILSIIANNSRRIIFLANDYLPRLIAQSNKEKEEEKTRQEQKRKEAETELVNQQKKTNEELAKLKQEVEEAEKEKIRLEQKRNEAEAELVNQKKNAKEKLEKLQKKVEETEQEKTSQEHQRHEVEAELANQQKKAKEKLEKLQQEVEESEKEKQKAEKERTMLELKAKEAKEEKQKAEKEKSRLEHKLKETVQQTKKVTHIESKKTKPAISNHNKTSNTTVSFSDQSKKSNSIKLSCSRECDRAKHPSKPSPDSKSNKEYTQKEADSKKNNGKPKNEEQGNKKSESNRDSKGKGKSEPNDRNKQESENTVTTKLPSFKNQLVRGAFLAGPVIGLIVYYLLPAPSNKPDLALEKEEPLEKEPDATTTLVTSKEVDVDSEAGKKVSQNLPVQAHRQQEIQTEDSVMLSMQQLETLEPCDSLGKKLKPTCQQLRKREHQQFFSNVFSPYKDVMFSELSVHQLSEHGLLTKINCRGKGKGKAETSHCLILPDSYRLLSTLKGGEVNKVLVNLIDFILSKQDEHYLSLQEQRLLSKAGLALCGKMKVISQDKTGLLNQCYNGLWNMVSLKGFYWLLDFLAHIPTIEGSIDNLLQRYKEVEAYLLTFGWSAETTPDHNALKGSFLPFRLRL